MTGVPLQVFYFIIESIKRRRDTFTILSIIVTAMNDQIAALTDHKIILYLNHIILERRDKIYNNCIDFNDLYLIYYEDLDIRKEHKRGFIEVSTFEDSVRIKVHKE